MEGKGIEKEGSLTQVESGGVSPLLEKVVKKWGEKRRKPGNGLLQWLTDRKERRR